MLHTHGGMLLIIMNTAMVSSYTIIVEWTPIHVSITPAFEMIIATPLQTDHDRWEEKRRTVDFFVLRVGGTILPRAISELVNNLGLSNSRNILLLLAVDVPWYVREVGIHFQWPRNNTALSLPPAARNNRRIFRSLDHWINRSLLDYSITVLFNHWITWSLDQ